MKIKTFITRFFICVVLILSIGASSSFAQSLAGTILDEKQSPVANANVSYQSSAGRSPHTVRTDSQGRFSIPKLKADNYDVRASGRGIFSDWEKNVSLGYGQSKALTLRLIYSRKDAKTLAAQPKKQKL